MKTVTRDVFIASDGKEFFDIAEATSYQSALENEVSVDNYCASNEDLSERAKAAHKNIIMKYLAFCAVQEANADPAAGMRDEEADEAA